MDTPGALPETRPAFLRAFPQVLSKLLLLFAGMLALIHGMTFWNRATIHQHKAGYRQERFVVTGASFIREEGGVDYFLKGTIAGREEILPPRFPRGIEPRGRADLVRAYPLGTEIPVIFNPGVSDKMMINGEPLRVIQGGMDFLDDEPRRWREAAVKTFVPLSLALIFYFMVRHIGRRHPGISTSREPA